MKFLKQFLFTFAAVVGLALAVSAQKNNDDQKKPKEPPPKIKPGEKPPPKGNDKPKKPGMSYVILGTSEEMRAD